MKYINSLVVSFNFLEVTLTFLAAREQQRRGSLLKLAAFFTA